MPEVGVDGAAVAHDDDPPGGEAGDDALDRSDDLVAVGDGIDPTVLLPAPLDHREPPLVLELPQLLDRDVLVRSRVPLGHALDHLRREPDRFRDRRARLPGAHERARHQVVDGLVGQPRCQALRLLAPLPGQVRVGGTVTALHPHGLGVADEHQFHRGRDYLLSRRGGDPERRSISSAIVRR